MNVAAIICEYNPFHNGHQFHIAETRRLAKADSIIAVMSGNFVQRGEVAVYAKEVRAKAAILSGADLVIELPTVYSTGSAEFFAKGAVRLIDALGIVNCLSFGAETPEVDKLSKIAKLLADEPREFSDQIKKYAKDGLSFPNARAKAAGSILGIAAEDILSLPNNILAIEYLKAVISANVQISPIAIARKGVGHNSVGIDSGIASATFIRSLLKSNKVCDAFCCVPKFATELFKESPMHFAEELEKAIICELIKMPADSLKNISDVSEGLENRIKKALTAEISLSELIETVKTKRYTHSRIRRVILSAFLGITDSERRQSPSYIKILAHNQTGQKLIAEAKKTAKLPIVRNTSQIKKLKNPTAMEQWERERIFDSIYKMTEIK